MVEPCQKENTLSMFSRQSDIINFSLHLMIYLFFKTLLFIVIVSLITFLHLFLDHRLIDIQDWIYTNSWVVYIIILVTSFLTVLKLIAVLSPLTSLREIIKSEVKSDESLKVPFMLCSVFLLSSIIISQPERIKSVDFSSLGLLVSYVGHIIYFGTKLIVIFLLDKILSVSRKQLALITLIFIPLTMMIDGSIIKFGPQYSQIPTLCLIPCIVVTCFAQPKSLKTGLLLIVFAIAPFLSLLGMDLLWGDDKTMYTLKNPFSIVEFLMMSLLLCLYPLINKKSKGY